MKAVIFGSTGRTGKHLIEQALAGGYDVTAFARTPAKLSINHPRLQIVQGNVLDFESVDRALEAQEVVFCALGLNRDDPVTALAEGTLNILQAMKRHNVERILCVSAAGFLGERADFLVGKVLLWFFRRYMKKLFGAMNLQYEALQKSGLKWTAVRPILLDEGPRKGHYRIAIEDIPKGGYRINTGDVAEFMLRQALSNEFVGLSPAIAY
jgi:putative NADH-flavin reductase